MTGIITYADGLQTTDLYPGFKRLFISHPSVTNELCITEFESYNCNYENYLESGDRTLKGGLTVNGGYYNPTIQLQVNCILNQEQKYLFDKLKRYQDSTKVPITIQNYLEPIIYLSAVMSVVPTWLSGYPVTNLSGDSVGYAAFLVWLDIDANYAKNQADTFLIQFRAKGI